MPFSGATNGQPLHIITTTWKRFGSAPKNITDPISSFVLVRELTLAIQMTPVRREMVEQAYKRDRQKLLRFIKRRVPTSEVAEDLLQDVFFSLGAQMEPITEVTNWLYRVARNRIIDWYRKKRTTAMPTVQEEPGAEVLLSEMIPSGDDPNSDYLRSALWDELDVALNELPEAQREVFIMHELDGMSFKQMAEMTGIPLNTLLTRKHYAVTRLRERLQDFYNEFNNS